MTSAGKLIWVLLLVIACGDGKPKIKSSYDFFEDVTNDRPEEPGRAGKSSEGKTKTNTSTDDGRSPPKKPDQEPDSDASDGGVGLSPPVLSEQEIAPSPQPSTPALFLISRALFEC